MGQDREGRGERNERLFKKGVQVSSPPNFNGRMFNECVDDTWKFHFKIVTDKLRFEKRNPSSHHPKGKKLNRKNTIVLFSP